MTSDQTVWFRAQEQLSHFTLHRCVTMKHEDWRELSGVLTTIMNLYSASSRGSHGDGPPAFTYTLELLLQLGQVTSCLLSLNGDDPAFSVARVAQAINTTTCVLESCHNLSQGAGLPADIADSLARQRCEQTPLLQAMAWALRQEARALFFNPRPTALSLATALLDLFRAIERIWPDDIFAASSEAAAAAVAAKPLRAGDPTAARLADPAAQLAMAMMRCAGRAMAEIGASASKQTMLSGLRVADDLMHQICSVMMRAADMPAEQQQVKQLLQSPSILGLMLTMLALQTQRLQQQLGMNDADSFTYRHPVKHNVVLPTPGQSEDDMSSDHSSTTTVSAAQADPVASPAGSTSASSPQQQSRKRQLKAQQQHQQRKKQQEEQQQQQQQHYSDEEEERVRAGAGDLHQIWHQVLGMAKKQAAVQQPQTKSEDSATPLLQFWKALGLPEAMLALAAASDVFTRQPDVEYVQACKVARFLLQGSAHLQPGKDSQRRYDAGSAAAAALDLAGHSTAAADIGSRARDRSPLSPRLSIIGRLGSFGLTTRESVDLASSGREGAMSPTAATAALLVDTCRDYGFRGQEELELLSLQRLLPVVLLDTAVSLTSGQFACPMAAAAAAQHGATAGSHSRLQESSSGSSLARLSCSSCSTPSPLEMVSAACAAAAYSARCWPVLQKVAAVQSGAPFSLDGAPSGVFSGLSTVYWQQYELEQPEMHLPVQELLQLVVQAIQQLFGQPRQQKQLCRVSNSTRYISKSMAAATNTAVDQGQHQNDQSAEQPDLADHTQGIVGTAIIPSRPPLSPKTREALWGLLEVLTAVSKLPWDSSDLATDPKRDLEHRTKHQQQHCRHSSMDGTALPLLQPVSTPASRDHKQQQRQQQLDRLYTAEAWQAMSQRVAAAVEAVLRSCSGTSAIVPTGPKRAADCATLSSSARAADRNGVVMGCKYQTILHPATVALGSCLASMCAPLGRPGPLVAAVAATEPGSTAQLQLFALLASKIKLMLTDTSGRKELIAMHPIEQTPVHILKQLSKHLELSANGLHSSVSTGESGVHSSMGRSVSSSSSSNYDDESVQPSAAAVKLQIAAAAVPWLLILARLIKLRGRLLGELLQHDTDTAALNQQSNEATATATLHNAFWHTQMATASALALEKYMSLLGGISSSAVGSTLAQYARDAAVQLPGQLPLNADVPVGGYDLQMVLQQLQHELLPTLKHAVQLLKAAIKLARHYHETDFASGFASGFAAGYAAALAASSGSTAAPAGGRNISFASPAGVLQHSCIANLPAQLKAFGGVLSGQLMLPFWCNNPHCLNMSMASELQLLVGDAAHASHIVVCGKCAVALYCSEGCKAQHKTRHKPVCKQLCKQVDRHTPRVEHLT